MFLFGFEASYTEIFYSNQSIVAVESVLAETNIDYNISFPDSLESYGMYIRWESDPVTISLAKERTEFDARFTLEGYPLAHGSGQLDRYTTRFIFTDTGSNLSGVDFNPYLSIAYYDFDYKVNTFWGDNSGEINEFAPGIGIEFPTQFGSFSIEKQGKWHSSLDNAIILSIQVQFN